MKIPTKLSFVAAVSMIGFSGVASAQTTTETCEQQQQQLQQCISENAAGEVPCNWVVGALAGIGIDLLTDDDSLAAFLGIAGGYASEYACDNVIDYGVSNCYENNTLDQCEEEFVGPPAPNGSTGGEGEDEDDDGGDNGDIDDLFENLDETDIEWGPINEWEEGDVTVEDLYEEL